MNGWTAPAMGRGARVTRFTIEGLRRGEKRALGPSEVFTVVSRAPSWPIQFSDRVL